ncbi:MAG: GNAT family N-acetyltransferase [Candidatus Edwardsbacteria bacterium]|nr:GNAT family N-acetyltransferase [Candidatus Edwardsbacteria bacterium]
MDTDIRDYRANDNAGLAAMWNESQKAWPTGFGGATGYTEERIANEMKRKQALFQLVSECDGKITGYCWVSIYPREPDACYVALLNVHPDFHGQGLGKRMILESVRRAVTLGYFRLDLNTWPSNLKAVPMYKKTGFFWQPDTSVHMQNYIPGIIRHPACAEFFSNNDWYATFKRSYDQEPDEIKRGRRNVFPYRFEAGEKFVEAVIDTESRKIMRVATETFSAGLRLDDPEVIVGRQNFVFFEYEGRDAAERTIRWRTPDHPGLRMDTADHTVGQFEVAAWAAVPENDEPAIAVGANVERRGPTFDLNAGIRPRQPVEIEWRPRPGKRRALSSG